jgi:glycosyltransferase involved in cell wall biosynthesis
MPTVTVVIPVFNGQRFIGEAIRSVLAQTFHDVEIIVVDDGSTDGTASVVRRFIPAVSYYRQENSGAGVARNLGVSAARGEWIAFLDADDLWYPSKLTVQFDHVHKYPEAEFVYSDLDAVDEQGNVVAHGLLRTELERRKKNPRSSLIRLVFGDRPFPRPSTVLLGRRVFLNAGGFNPNFRRSNHEDFDLFARIARIGAVHFIPESLAQYRLHALQGSHDTAGSDENWLLLLHSLWETYRNEPEKQTKLLHYYARYFCHQGRDLLVAGDYHEARRRFSVAFHYEPLYKKNLSRWALSYLPPLREFYTARRRGISLPGYKDAFRRCSEYARRAFFLSKQ